MNVSKSAILRSAGVSSTSCNSIRATQQIVQCRKQSKNCKHHTVKAAAAVEVYSARQDIKDAKQALLTWISGTKRGSQTSKQLRGQVEEAQVAVEALSPAELDYNLLEGKWLLIYTTAADVVPIVALDFQLPMGLPSPVTVGNVYQQFSSVDRGIVQNIIEFSVPFILENNSGTTFTVEASYEVRSGRRIALTFEQAEVGQVRISPALEALIAPALLPRGYIQQQLLLAIKEFKLVFPFRSAQQVAQGSGVAANYLLTYLDEDMLIGRASGTAGTFIFQRVEQDGFNRNNSSTDFGLGPVYAA